MSNESNNKQSSDKLEVLSADDRVNVLAQTLSRNTAQIKADRATEIAELAEVEAKRKVEDLERELRVEERRKKSALDLSPDNTYNIMKVKDFEPTEFVAKYSEIGLKIRELKIKLDNAKQTYNELFGNVYELSNIS
jgi:hypothetical protein